MSNANVVLNHMKGLAEERNKALQNVSELQQKLREANDKTYTLEQENSDLLRKLTVANKELESLQSNLDSKSFSLRNFKECNDILQTENESSKRQTILLENKLDQTEKALLNASAQLDSANHKVDEQKISLRSVRIRLKTEELRYSDAQKNLTLETQKVSNLECRVMELESRISFLDQEIDRIENVRNEAILEITKYKDLFESVNIKSISLEAINERIASKQNKFETDIEILTNQCQSYEREMEEAKRNEKVSSLKIEELTNLLNQESKRRTLLKEDIEKMMEEAREHGGDHDMHLR